MSGKIHIEHQLGLSSSENIRYKESFVQISLEYVVLASEYLTDIGVFKSNALVRHIREHNQKLIIGGVNAHHQNGIAERAIRTMSEMTREQLLHASSLWKEGISSALWPMAVDYASFIYNNLPGDSGVSPNDLFIETQTSIYRLNEIHT